MVVVAAEDEVDGGVNQEGESYGAEDEDEDEAHVGI